MKDIDTYLIGNGWERFESYRSNTSRGLLTGFPEIDRTIIGLPGFVTVMGEPKSFKSTFTLNIVLHKALEGTPIILIDKENGIQRTRLRMLCWLSQLSPGAVKSNNLTKAELDRYEKARDTLTELPIYYLHEQFSKEELESLIYHVGKKHRSHILLVADSLQSLIIDFKDRRSSVDYWVFLFNELKLKYENWLTIIIVSEKNRGSYGESSKAGAKESGGVEYKSEMVLDLYPNKEGITQVECVFNRDGDTGFLTQLLRTEPYCYRLKTSEEMPS